MTGPMPRFERGMAFGEQKPREFSVNNFDFASVVRTADVGESDALRSSTSEVLGRPWKFRGEPKLPGWNTVAKVFVGNCFLKRREWYE